MIPIISCLILIILVISVLVRHVSGQADMPLEFVRLLTSVAGNILVTGIVSLLILRHLAQQDREDQQRNRRSESLVAARRELKSAFESVQIACLTLAADPSAGCFVTESSRLLEAREKLQSVQREPFVMLANNEASQVIQNMLNSLSKVIEEYRKNYQYLRVEALREEARMERVRTGVDRDLTTTNLTAVGLFPILSAWLQNSEYGDDGFWDGYAAAKRWLDGAVFVDPAV